MKQLANSLLINRDLYLKRLNKHLTLPFLCGFPFFLFLLALVWELWECIFFLFFIRSGSWGQHFVRVWRHLSNITWWYSWLIMLPVQKTQHQPSPRQNTVSIKSPGHLLWQPNRCSGQRELSRRRKNCLNKGKLHQDDMSSVVTLSGRIWLTPSSW